VAGLEVEQVGAAGGRDLGLQGREVVEGLAGDRDPEVAAAAPGELQAGADQDVDALVGLDAAEEEDLERRPRPPGGRPGRGLGHARQAHGGVGQEVHRSAGMPWARRWSRMFSVWGM
jgi:hypothetical protein